MLTFTGSMVSPGQGSIIILNVLFIEGKDTIMVSLPNNTWADNQALFNSTEVNFSLEYDNRVNQAIKKAKKLFPNWSI